MRKRIVLSLIAYAMPLAAQAQFAKPEDAIKYRQSAFTSMSTHLGGTSAAVTSISS